ncbi:MAG TPA: toll/interleukin-1 receptor domain-containing protein [Streptosporangiaceae bacterium]|nr:toll/interleukin-1 receptor domain-containing protein [Streptosporangiaceae bacterium]
MLREAELQLLGVTPQPGDLEALHERVWEAGELKMESLELGREDQPLWYTRIDRSLMILASRRLWPVLDPVNVRLAGEVINGFDSSQRGWRNHRKDMAICTWKTAESFLTVELIANDLSKEEITLDAWNARREGSEALRTTDGFDVGISFSSSQRDVAARIRRRLRGAGLTVFYDEDYQHELLGADLNVYLHDTYLRRCRYAVAILSQDFVDSNWSGSTEWRAILSRLQASRSDFLLPYYVDDVQVPGLSPSIGFLRSTTHSPEEFAEVAIRKILSQRPL